MKSSQTLNVGLITLTCHLIVATSVLGQPSNEPARVQIPTLNVTGTAEVSVKPDQVTIRLGAVTQAEEASGAQAQVNDIMTRAIDAIRKLGVPEDSISTVGLSLFPVYAEHRPRPGEAQPHEPRIVGYRASNTVRVRLDQLTRVGDVIDAGIEAGANQLEGLAFGLKDETSARTAALRDAARQARAKADAIAETMNLRMDGVLEVIEGGVQVMPKYYEMGARVMAADAGTPVQPGQVDVNATVTVAYRISAK